MNSSQLTGRWGWLSVVLAGHRGHLARILARLRGIGASAGASLSLHRKFMRLLDQVAFEQEKELDILHQIEAVEQQHRQLRQRKLLRQAATMDDDPAYADMPPDIRESKPSSGILIKLAGLLYLFSTLSKKQKTNNLQ